MKVFFPDSLPCVDARGERARARRLAASHPETHGNAYHAIVAIPQSDIPETMMAVQTTKFSGTHLARLLLLSPSVLSAVMPALLQLYILHPPTFSSPVSLFDAGIGPDLQAFVLLLGLVTLIWSQVLEARRRQKVPASDQKQKSRWASTLGGCTTKDTQSILAWSRFDRFEAACVCASAAVSVLLTAQDFTLGNRIAMAVVCLPTFGGVIVILKSTVHAVVYAQGNSFPLWVTDTATPVLFKALLFEMVVVIMWVHASMYAPYPKPQLEAALTVMLDTDDNWAILCDNEAAFWASFSLPFEWSGNHEPLECDEPTCGYTSWRDLCQARRLAPLANATKRTVWYQLWTVPILLVLIINLFGNGQIARGRQGEKGLLAPHILLTLGLGFCALCVSIYYAAIFSIYYAAINYGALLGVFDAKIAAHDRPLANPT